MATAGQSAVLPGLTRGSATVEESGHLTEQRAGPVLLLGGTAFASAYVVVGVLGLSLWGALLAIGGTALVLLGLKLVVLRSS